MPDPHVVVVDDDRAFSRALTVFLESQGFSVTVAMNGHEAMALARRLTFDAAVVDFRLPDTFGTEVTRFILQHHPAVPVVMVSADGSEANRKRCLATGAWSFLVKPIEPNGLVKTLSDALEAGSSND